MSLVYYYAEGPAVWIWTGFDREWCIDVCRRTPRIPDDSFEHTAPFGKCEQMYLLTTTSGYSSIDHRVDEAGEYLASTWRILSIWITMTFIHSSWQKLWTCAAFRWIDYSSFSNSGTLRKLWLKAPSGHESRTMPPKPGYRTSVNLAGSSLNSTTAKHNGRFFAN